MLRAALIGCGNIATALADDPRSSGVNTHAGAYQACAGTTLVAVCDNDVAAVERCGQRWHVAQTYTDVAAMLTEAQPEIVSVCTPDVTHAAILDRVLQSPNVKGILAEKPLALDEAEGERLVTRARESGVAIAVNYTRRYTEGHQKVRETIEGGKLGWIQTVSGHYTKGVLHNGTHWFDLVRWLIGDINHASVQGFPALDIDAQDPSPDIYFHFESGARGCLLACSPEAFSIFEVDITGTDGRVRIDDSGHRIEWFEVIDSKYYSGYRALGKTMACDNDMSNALLRAVEDLVLCIQKGTTPKCSGADALAALRVGRQAIRSSRLSADASVEVS